MERSQHRPPCQTLEDFSYRFHPWTEEEHKEFISVLGGVVEKNELEELKGFVYSMREIGTHAPSSVRSQLEDFHKLLKSSYGEERAEGYANMLAELIRPEHLPSLDELTSPGYPGLRNREIFESLLSANLRLPRQTFEGREILFEAAIALIQDDRVEIQTREGERYKNEPLRLVAGCLIENQIDRKLEPLWWTVFNESEPSEDNFLEKRLRTLPWGFGIAGITRMPAADGSFNRLPLDVAPEAWKAYVDKIEQREDEGRKKQLYLRISGWLYKYPQEDFEELFRRADPDSWPDWAKEAIVDARESIRKAREWKRKEEARLAG